MSEHDDRPVRPGQPWDGREPAAPPADPSSVTAPRPAVSRLSGATDPTVAAAAELDRAASASAAATHERDGDAARGRGLPGPRWLWWAVAGVVLLVVGVVAYLALSGDEEPAPAATVTVEAPVPVPDVEPVERGEGSALFLALPGSVRQYSLQSVTASDEHTASGALEGYELTYSGRLDDAMASYVVSVAQWATPEEAAAVAAALAEGAGVPTSSGEVTVGDVVTGTYVITGSDGDLGSAVWTNGSVLVRAVGPGQDIENVYRAYGF